jgi:hypothetical protein
LTVSARFRVPIDRWLKPVTFIAHLPFGVKRTALQRDQAT